MSKPLIHLNLSMDTTATITEKKQQEYISYPAPDCPQGWFIHEYPNGRKVLLEVDPITGKETFLKTL